MSTNLKCSFCGKGRRQVKKLIEGQPSHYYTPYICNECIMLSYEVIHEKEDVKEVSILCPEEIKEELDKYVVCQNNPKEILSVAIYNHYKRISNPVMNGITLNKSNVLLMGPSGCGKTLMASTIARLLDIPFVMTDATSLTEAGYIGGDVDSIFENLYRCANGDLKKAQNGIVFIDEIDKKCNKSVNGENSRDISGEGVQQSLLRLIEGTTIQMNIKKGKTIEEVIDFDTSNILFIIGGAFVGIEKIIGKRLGMNGSIGIGAKVDNTKTDYSLLEQVEPEDLCAFGFIREFIGRFPVLIAFHDLDESALLKIMKEPQDNILDQFKILFGFDNVELLFSDEYLRSVAAKAKERNVGARGIRSILEKTLSPIQFTLPRLSKEGLTRVVIDELGCPIYDYDYSKIINDKKNANIKKGNE